MTGPRYVVSPGWCCEVVTLNGWSAVLIRSNLFFYLGEITDNNISSNCSWTAAGQQEETMKWVLIVAGWILTCRGDKSDRRLFGSWSYWRWDGLSMNHFVTQHYNIGAERSTNGIDVSSHQNRQGIGVWRLGLFRFVYHFQQTGIIIMKKGGSNIQLSSQAYHNF